MAVDPRIVNILTEEAPAIIGLVQSLFAQRHPTDPVPTSAEVIAAWESLYASDVARDEQLLKDNPE